MSLHSGVKYLHIGCDEVFHMAECSLCQLHAKDDLFLSHVHRVASYVRSKYKVVPIIWDDMLRHMTSASLEESKLGELVEPMVWVCYLLYIANVKTYSFDLLTITIYVGLRRRCLSFCWFLCL